MPMKQYNPSDEVDFVIIGSGAGGGVMAKKLSEAGFSCVVLEQGPWASFGHEESANKDELFNRFPSPEEQLLSDPQQTGLDLPPQCQREGASRSTIPMAASSAAAP